MRVVGLTGGIASGKSLVSQAFRELGVEVLDADQVSREIVRPGQPALADIAAAFGPEALSEDGSLDRAYMRRLVFSDPEKRKILEQITHPRIRAHIDQWLASRQGPYAVIENAILIESGMHDRVDRVLVVDVPEAVQRQRLLERDGIDLALAERMLASQLPREARLKHADDVIVNDARPEDAIAQVQALHVQYRAPKGVE